MSINKAIVSMVVGIILAIIGVVGSLYLCNTISARSLVDLAIIVSPMIIALVGGLFFKIGTDAMEELC